MIKDKKEKKEKEEEVVIETAEIVSKLPSTRLPNTKQSKPKETGSTGMGFTGAMGYDEDRDRALTEVVRFLANFPKDKLFSFTRWRRREIPLIASELTRLMAVDPNRPRNADGTRKSLAQIHIENIAWLRLAEEGSLRNELIGVGISQTEEKAIAEAWKE